VGTCPRIGQYGSLPAVSSRAQEGRDVICSHETDSQTRSVSTTRPEWGQRRSIAYCNRGEPEAARQTSLPCPAPSGSALPSVGTQMETDAETRESSKKPPS
jgi:hypothetical protein